jgi:hypothetical protein
VFCIPVSGDEEVGSQRVKVLYIFLGRDGMSGRAVKGRNGDGPFGGGDGYFCALDFVGGVRRKLLVLKRVFEDDGSSSVSSSVRVVGIVYIMVGYFYFGSVGGVAF